MFCLHCGKEIPEQSAFCMACGTTINPTQRRFKPWVLIGAVAVLLAGLAVGVKNFADRRSSPLDSDTATERSPSLSHSPQPVSPPQPVYVPRTEKLTSGQVTVKARNIYYVRFKVDTAMMSSVRVVGNFRVSGGSGNDVQAVIADEDNFENWKNGHEARVLYSTGKTTLGTIDVPIDTSGTYILGFSNRFSAFTEKFVFGDIELRYTVKQ